MFKCKYCNKEFETKQKLGGHIIHCKMGPHYENSLQNLSNARQHIQRIYHKNNEICECEYCHQLYSIYGIKQHIKSCKQNPNIIEEKRSKGNGGATKGYPIWNKGLTKETDERVRNYVNTLKQKYESGEIIPSWSGRKHTEEQKLKISQALKQYLEEHPDKVPYKLNHHSKQSYPEQYFEEIFNNDEILKDCEKEYKVGLYSLDFALPNIKFYIEIDGEQHYVDKRIIEHDKNRTEVLNNLGWTCYRIRWSEYQKLNFEERQSIINEIKTIIREH